MKKILSLLAVAVAVLLFSGCRASTVYNVENHPMPVKNLPDSKVQKAIKSAGAELGWVITDVKPGLMRGSLHLRGHTAVVDIPYTDSTYSIKYVSSTNLKYDAEKNTIHSNYNSWVQNLQNAIDVKLSAE